MNFNTEQEELVRDILPDIQEVTERNIHYLQDDRTLVKISIKEYFDSVLPSQVRKDPDFYIWLQDHKKEAFLKFKTLLAKISSELRESVVRSGSSSDITKKITTLVPCVDPTNLEKIILIDKDTKEKTPYDYKTFNYLLGWEMQDIYSRCMYAKHIYNPRSDKTTYTINYEGQNMEVVNTYRPPHWRKVDIENPTLPPLFIKFFNHLFPIQDEREYVYDWLHKSLTDRAYVYLVLNGKKGVGKNTFKLLFRALHGAHNFVDGKKSLLTTQFNSQLEECRALVLDEIRYTEDEENVLKEIQNDYLSIERKGEDATRGSIIHCSIVLMNNEAKDNYIAVDSRRFSPMQLGDKNLNEVMTEEEISTLLGKLKEEGDEFDLDFVANIGHWILRLGRDPRFGKEADYKGPKFYELVQTSLSEWKKFILLEIANLKRAEGEGSIRLSEIAENFSRKYKSRRTFPDFTRVINFCEYYKDKNGQKYIQIKAMDDEDDFELSPYVEEDL